MGAEIFKLLEEAIAGGGAFASLLTIILAGLLAGVGAYVGSYLRKKGEYKAILEHLKQQTRITEGVRYEFEALLLQHSFLREQYAGIAKYSTEQAWALRQAYLLLYEPEKSGENTEGKSFEERVDEATEKVMAPLRQHLGLLDQETEEKIYSIRNQLDLLKSKKPEEQDAEIQEIINATRKTAQFVKIEEIARRLGLIHYPLHKTGGQTINDKEIPRT